MALTLILKILAVIQCQLVKVATVTPIDTMFILLVVALADASFHKLQLIINNIVPSFIITFDPTHLSSNKGWWVLVI
jgi:hypothetical protein